MPSHSDKNSNPPVTNKATSNAMRANRRADTGPELAVRSLLHRRGYRFWKDFRIVEDAVRVRADIVFPSARLAIFIDGCFWHGCPEHHRMPASNLEYWKGKLARNLARDKLVTDGLKRAGWTVLRLWEHVDAREAAITIEEALVSLGEPARKGTGRV